jgi:hypothetical protein
MSSMSVSDILKYSDLTSALVGAGFASAYNTGTPGMAATQALITSILARLLSDSLLKDRFSTLSNEGKNQMIVGILGGLYSYSRKGSVFKSALTSISVDLIGAEVIKLFNMEDGSVFDKTKSKEPEPVR